MSEPTVPEWFRDAAGDIGIALGRIDAVAGAHPEARIPKLVPHFRRLHNTKRFLERLADTLEGPRPVPTD